MQNTINPSVVRVFNSSEDNYPRKAVGAGFIVSSRHIMTAAHVVNSALGFAQRRQEIPETEIQFDCPLLEDRTILRARVVHWLPMNEQAQMGEAEDIAVLELMPTDKFPVGSKPAKLFEPDSFLHREVLMYGFPQDKVNGTHTLGRLLSTVADGKVQLEHRPGYREVEPGFSGTAAWDTQQHAVVGMVVYVDWLKGVPTTFMVSVGLLKKILHGIYIHFEEPPSKKLTFDDMIDLGYLDLISDIFNSSEKAITPLRAIKFPRRNTPAFSSPRLFWEAIFQDIEDGRVDSSFEDLLKAFSIVYPHNAVLSKFI